LHGGNISLFLTRRIGESLLIGDDIIVTVRKVNGNQVGVGIEAPEDVLVLREELLYKDRPPREAA